MFPADFLRSPVAVVCHDAGAASLVIGWLSNSVGLRLRAHMQGPALGLWRGLTPLASGHGWMPMLRLA
jgi:hypothetical protein